MFKFLREPPFWRYVRPVVFFWQRRSRGFDDSELWSLDDTLARWMLPRLRRFREMKMSYPCDLSAPEEWLEMIDKMILAFDLIIRKWDEDWAMDPESEEWKQINEGLDLFRARYFDLWD